MVRTEELPYRPDTASLFDAIADEPWAVFLDSGRHEAGRSRYDIIACEPAVTLLTRGGLTEICSGEGVRIAPEDPFTLLRETLQPGIASIGSLPFAGGAIGYFGYDLGRRLERLPSIASDDSGMPEMAIGIYPWAVLVDHLDERSWLASSGPHVVPDIRWARLLERFSAPPKMRRRSRFRALSPVRSTFTESDYVAAFKRIQRYIREGDCYQVNLAQRFEFEAEGNPWGAYRRLRERNPVPFGAYLNVPFAQVLSASPERFLQVRAGQVVTQPIKGTRPRSLDPRLDAQRIEELRASAKDRAENVMIVDLLRNDLAKNCRIGSIRVPQLFEVRSYPSVHHLVSTVEGEVAPGREALDVLRGCFPGGSITGAPKLRAMQIIEALESRRRALYCGSIGYIGFDGAMDTNIAIRTLVHRDGHAHFWAGGGIVADSQAASEYQETLDKAAPFFDLVREPADANERT